MAKDAWNGVGTSYQFSSNATSPDVTVKGYWGEAVGGVDECNSIACVRPTGTYPHTVKQTLLFEEPPKFPGERRRMWTIDPGLRTDSCCYYLPGTMMHELGHTLGLGHSRHPMDVMGSGKDKNVLSPNDRAGLRKIAADHPPL